MKSEIHPLRVLLKAILLFVVINIVFALVNPPVGKISLYNHLIPGRLRFPYDNLFPNMVNYSVPMDEDLDAMFAAHVISARKPANEFRLILLGDSATWGFGLPAKETLSEQINQLHIQTCDRRVVHAYNLAYPVALVTRDLLILDKALEYQPDMVFWVITLSSLESKGVKEVQIIAPHRERYLQLASAYDLKLSHFSPPIHAPSFWERTIVGQRKHLKNLALTQMFGVLWAATGIDNRRSTGPAPDIPSPDVKRDEKYWEWSPDEGPAFFDSLATDVLSAAYKIAGDVPIVLVNEPIFVASGRNHLIRYNGFYPRWVYDEYRQFILEWTNKHNHELLDYWNALPPEDFYDPLVHLRVSGQKHFAELLVPEIKKIVCP